MTEGNTPGASYGPAAAPQEVAVAAASALTLGYSAPMPGNDSRYSDGTVAHETRLLSVPALAAAASRAAELAVGETVLESVLDSASVTGGYTDFRTAGYIAPLARAALLGERLGRVLAGLSHADARSFARALEAAGGRTQNHLRGTLYGAINVALGAGRDATLRDAMRFAADNPGDPLAREYAKGFEVTRELAHPALMGALARVEATRSALVQAYLEVLAEVPDPDVAGRAGQREAEDVSRMAHGVLKAGGVYSRRGLQAVSNLDGLLRSDARLKPSASEPPIIAAAFLLALEYGPGYLNGRVRPVAQR